jgi:isopentenyl diphosphate isomerase/L-lactate dehydrogenase-like FMN-dependent dehydrogenase
MKINERKGYISMEQKTRAGDANNITREYFDSLLIEMRHIDAVIPNTSLNLYGETFATPVMMAALSHLNNCHPEGMVELARGAKAADSVMWAGMGGYDELERITATGAKTIKIIKPYADNDEVFRKIEHAEKCGCIAVGMDTDHAFNGRGEYDAVHDLKMSGKSLDEIKRFVKSTKLPFIIKGVLSVQDALKCIEAGIKGIVVSHHHGILDYAVPPLMVLPKIIEAIDGRMPVFVDCGVESGLDVFKALALGATAVSAGRVMMKPLSESGADGVAKKVQDMTAQLAGAMARTCSHNIAQIEPSLIWKK